eukprot:3426579-Alexandrium_andersonii.AAC.1
MHCAPSVRGRVHSWAVPTRPEAAGTGDGAPAVFSNSCRRRRNLGSPRVGVCDDERRARWA